MNFTQEQISELLLTIASEKDGYRLLLQQSLESIMRAERQQFNKEHNGYRFSKVCVYNGQMELMIPRSRHHNFYPLILALRVVRNDEPYSLTNAANTNIWQRDGPVNAEKAFSVA